MRFRTPAASALALGFCLCLAPRSEAAPPNDSDSMKRDVIRQVQRQFWAGRVEAESARFELGKGLTVRNLTYYAGFRPADPPLVRMREMVLVIPVQELIRRTYRAQQVILVDPVLTLDFDAAGNPLFQPPFLDPPVPLSTMTIRGGRVLIRRQERSGPPRLIPMSGAEITMSPDPNSRDGSLAQRVQGTIADAGPDLGALKFSGRFLGRVDPPLPPPGATPRPDQPVSRFVRRQANLELDVRNAAGGRATVHVQAPIEAGACPLVAEATTQALDLGRVASAFVPGLPPMAGRGTGQLRIQGPAERPFDPRRLEASGSLTFERLAVRAFVAERLRLGFEWHTGVLTAQTQGAAGDGQLDATTRVTFNEREKPQQKSHLALRSFSLDSLDSLLPATDGPKMFQGKGQVDLNLDVAGGLTPETLTGSGRARVSDLTLGRGPRIGVATTALTLEPGRLELRDLAVQLGGGTATGDATYRFRGAETELGGEFRFEQIDPSRIAPPGNAIFASLRGAAAGRLRFHSARGGRYQGSSGVGEVALQTWAGAVLPATKLQTHVAWSLTPDGTEGYVNLDDFRGQVAGGTLAGEIHLVPNDPLRTGGGVVFQNLDLATILNSASGGREEARGRVSGLFSLKGSAATANQVEAVIHFVIRDADLQHTAVVRAISRATGTPTNQVGNVRLGEGVLLLQNRTALVKNMILAGPYNRSRINGAMTSDGRLDLRIVSQPQNLASVRAHIQVTGPQKYPIARLTRVEFSSAERR